MDYLKYTLLFVVPISLIITSFRKVKKENTAPAYKSWTKESWIVFVITLIAAIGAIFISIEADVKTKIQKEIAINQRINDSIALSHKWQYDTLSYNKLLDSSRVIINKSIALYNKTIETSENQLNYISGGNSYGYVSISTIHDGDNPNILFTFTKVGKFPLYNVEITYWNLDDFKKDSLSSYLTIDKIDKYKNIQLGDFFNRNSKLFGTIFKINNNKIIKINLSISAKNGNFNEQLRICKRKGKILCAYKVNTITTGKKKPKVVLKHYDDDFPIDEAEIE